MVAPLAARAAGYEIEAEHVEVDDGLAPLGED